MEFQFKPGDEAFIMSRYKGEQKVRVVAQIPYEHIDSFTQKTVIEPCYELDKLVQTGKNYWKGSAQYEFHEQEHSMPEEHHEPCPEWMLSATSQVV